MKTAARSACVAVLVLVLAATASPALAKGPTDVEVSGPGVDTSLSYRQRVGDVDLGTLSEAARMYDVLGTDVLASAPDLTRAELGPRYTLTWTAGGAALLVQHAYPFADGGAWVRFLPTDSGWGSGATGWARTPALTEQIVALGASSEQRPSRPQRMVTTTEKTPGPAEPRGSEQSAGPPYDVLVAAGLLLAGVLAAGVLVLRRRRLSW